MSVDQSEFCLALSGLLTRPIQFAIVLFVALLPPTLAEQFRTACRINSNHLGSVEIDRQFSRRKNKSRTQHEAYAHIVESTSIRRPCRCHGIDYPWLLRLSVDL